MSFRRPDGEPAGIELFGNQNVRAEFDRTISGPTTLSLAGETAIVAVALMVGKSPRGKAISARLSVMSVEVVIDILPAGARPVRRGSN